MFIQIDDKWALASDEHSWMIKKWEKPCESVPNGRWKTDSWHTLFESAVQALARKKIRLADASTMAEAIKAAQEVREELTEALDLNGY